MRVEVDALFAGGNADADGGRAADVVDLNACASNVARTRSAATIASSVEHGSNAANSSPPIRRDNVSDTKGVDAECWQIA